MKKKASCPTCLSHTEEISFLRKQVTLLTEMLARANPLVSRPPIQDVAGSQLGYFGDGQDQYVSYDETGQKILLEQDLRLHELDRE